MKSIICGLCAISLAVFLGGCVRPTQDELRTDGIHEYQVGHHERAMAMFERVLHNEPSDAVSLFYMGRIYHTQQQYVKAYYYYQAAIDADPGFAYAASTRKYMKEVKEQLGDLAAPLTTIPKTSEHPVP
jgi:tetratricopeptide (TPR) repeat protein